MPPASIADLRYLLTYALLLQKMKPWEEFWEDEIFSLQPLDSPLVTVSVMGNRGEYAALAFYVGKEARAAVLSLHNSETPNPEEILPVLMSLHQIHLSFPSRKSLLPDQKKLLLAAGYILPKSVRVPHFETMRQGSLPGTLEAGDVALLKKILPETIATLERAFLLEVDLEPGDSILVREEISPGVWEDRFQPLSNADFQQNQSFLIRSTTKPLEGLKRSPLVWEILYAHGPGFSKRPGGGHDLLQVLLVCEPVSGRVELVQVFEGAPLPSHAAQGIHECLENFCRNNGFLPREIRVRDELLGAVLETFCREGGIDCRFQKELPAADEAYVSLMNALGPKKKAAKKKRLR